MDYQLMRACFFEVVEARTRAIIEKRGVTAIRCYDMLDTQYVENHYMPHLGKQHWALMCFVEGMICMLEMMIDRNDVQPEEDASSFLKKRLPLLLHPDRLRAQPFKLVAAELLKAHVQVIKPMFVGRHFSFGQLLDEMRQINGHLLRGSSLAHSRLLSKHLNAFIDASADVDDQLDLSMLAAIAKFYQMYSQRGVWFDKVACDNDFIEAFRFELHHSRALKKKALIVLQACFFPPRIFSLSAWRNAMLEGRFSWATRAWVAESHPSSSFDLLIQRWIKSIDVSLSAVNAVLKHVFVKKPLESVSLVIVLVAMLAVAGILLVAPLLMLLTWGLVGSLVAPLMTALLAASTILIFTVTLFSYSLASVMTSLALDAVIGVVKNGFMMSLMAIAESLTFIARAPLSASTSLVAAAGVSYLAFTTLGFAPLSACLMGVGLFLALTAVRGFNDHHPERRRPARTFVNISTILATALLSGSYVAAHIMGWEASVLPTLQAFGGIYTVPVAVGVLSVAFTLTTVFTLALVWHKCKVTVSKAPSRGMAKAGLAGQAESPGAHPPRSAPKDYVDSESLLMVVRDRVAGSRLIQTQLRRAWAQALKASSVTKA